MEQVTEINITGRHVSVTEAIKEYARKKLETHLGMDFPRVLSAHFILDVEKYRHIAELILVCSHHITVEAREVSEDLYASIDRVVDKVMRQLRKYKTKIQNHKPRRNSGVEWAEQAPGAEGLEHEEGTAPVVHKETCSVKPMTVDEALLQMELAQREFLVFLNADTGKVSVLYRRKKGDFRLIEPSLG